jgi:hypothetical protein
MPFSEQMSQVHVEIRKAVEEYAEITCLRADDLAHPAKITDDIWAKIQQARFAIADVTGSNPNVFYEVGLCHAIGKPVILLLEKGSQMPFDLSGIRYLRYSRTDFADLRAQLVKYIKGCLELKPPPPGSRKNSPDEPNVCITSIEAGQSTMVGKPTQITIKARNFGLTAVEGYFSVSFPSGVSVARAVESDIQTKTGTKGGAWKSGNVILDYPIVEGYVYGSTWPTGKIHRLIVEFTAIRPGFIQFYVSASAKLSNRPFVTDPRPGVQVVRDQRDEPVYCGVMEVKSQP